MSIDADPIRAQIYPGRYDLLPNEIESLTTQLLSDNPPNPDYQFVCYQLNGADKLSDIGRYVERIVFEDSFEGNDAAFMQKEYGPYEAASRFFVTVDTQKSRPVGVLRVITPSAAGLKTLKDFEQVHPIHAHHVYDHHAIASDEPVWDIGTVAVLPEYRDGSGKGSAASLQLFRAVYRDAMESDIKHLVSIIDKKAHAKLTGYLGVPFVALAGSPPFAYLGSKKSRAVYGRADEFYEKMTALPRGPLGQIRRRLAKAALQILVYGSRDDTIMPTK